MVAGWDDSVSQRVHSLGGSEALPGTHLLLLLVGKTHHVRELLHILSARVVSAQVPKPPRVGMSAAGTGTLQLQTIQGQG